MRNLCDSKFTTDYTWSHKTCISCKINFLAEKRTLAILVFRRVNSLLQRFRWLPWNYSQYFPLPIRFSSSLITSLSGLIDTYDNLTLRSTRLFIDTSIETQKNIYSSHTNTSKTMNHTARLNHTHTTLTTDESVPRLLECYDYVISRYTTPGNMILQ